jgi:hypothetical protein
METFIELKDLVENPQYQVQKKKILCDLNDNMIDTPIVDLINGFNKLSYCFTLQCCYGHFVYNGQNDTRNVDTLSAKEIFGSVEYRIAYVAFCIEKRASGRWLIDALNEITAIDPENIQFCCAEWFWNRQVNSYALQVEPDRFKYQDTAIIDFKEALHIENIRNTFFIGLYELLKNAK